MGSLRYAKRCKERNENIIAMISLETMGFFSDQKGSQRYPFPFNWLYPSTGNFIAFVGDLSSRNLVHQSIKAFRESTEFPSQGIATFSRIPGVDWSDHWSFWREGYPGIMITDTAIFRYPYYHQKNDTVEKIDYERLARVVGGIENIVRELTETK